MLPDALDDVRGDAGVQRPVASARHDVDRWLLHLNALPVIASGAKQCCAALIAYAELDCRVAALLAMTALLRPRPESRSRRRRWLPAGSSPPRGRTGRPGRSARIPRSRSRPGFRPVGARGGRPPRL